MKVLTPARCFTVWSNGVFLHGHGCRRTGADILTKMFARARGRILSSAVACSVNLRSPKLRRAQAAFGLIWAGEWAGTVAIGVVAFRHGGAAAVGVVSVARMVPAAIVAPFAEIIADRVRRKLVLA